MDFAPASSKEFLDIQATIECGFTLKHVLHMIRIYCQMHRTNKYSEHSSIILSVWPNGWVFDYEGSGYEFGSSCRHLNWWFHANFEQGFAWHSRNYGVWITYEVRTRHDKKIQSNPPYILVLRTKLNHLFSLAKWLSVRLRTKWLWVRVQLQSLHLQISRLLRARSSLTFRQLQSVDSLGNAYVTWQEHTVKDYMHYLTIIYIYIMVSVTPPPPLPVIMGGI